MWVRAITAGIVGAVAVFGAAQAAGLRAGGAFVASGEALPLAGASRPLEGWLGRFDPELRMGFTPRAGSGVLLAPGGETAPALDLRLGLAPATDGLDRLEGLGVTQPAVPLGAPAGETGSGLSIGGALAWSGWTIAGSWTSASLVRGELEVWTGRIGYGPLTARLGYGQEAALGRVEREHWLFGTDLATWPWLTLEGDLAVTTQGDREPTTAGRIGLRLKF